MTNKIVSAVNMELTSAIREYAEKRFASLDKFVREADTGMMEIEVSQTTNHHKQGAIFRAEVKMTADAKEYYAVSEAEDLYAAIDDVKEELERQITAKKDRDISLFRRGARSVKKMLKGISKRNPFTSKY